MLSAIIPTRESERSLVPTLNALFPGVMSGLLTEVIVADANSRDATREVADLAGCRFLSSEASLGERLKEAVEVSKGAWLLFLPAGSVPDGTWVDATQNFVGRSTRKAATFHSASESIVAALRSAIGGPRPDHGLLIAKRDYQTLGGHDGGEDADAALLRRLGRRCIATLPASVTVRRYT